MRNINLKGIEDISLRTALAPSQVVVGFLSVNQLEALRLVKIVDMVTAYTFNYAFHVESEECNIII
jgi:hypothetical protein